MQQRVGKTLVALLGGQGIGILTQFFLPPVFIVAYGVNGYGEWLVLSAAVGYLNTLDFGLGNYVTNQLTMLFHQGNLEDCRRLQSAGLRIMAGFLGLGTLVASLAFVLPVERWLDLSLPHTEAALCLFLLAVQILLAVAYGQLNGPFRACGQAHRGFMWANGYRVLLLMVTFSLAWSRSRFMFIALAQVLVILGGGFVMVVDLHRRKPALVPTWGTWDGPLARTVIRQSGFFALFTLNNFLLYQLPLLAINRVLGSAEVVMFSVARMLFSSARQLVSLAQSALTPEISRLYGLGDQPRLQRLYRMTESVVLSVVALVNVALLVCSPVLLTVWLKKPELFDLQLYLLLMAVAATISVKDYKLYFQYATNTHVRASLVTSGGNLVLAVLLVPSLRLGGVAGFAAAWWTLELLQLLLVHGFNNDVLGDRRHNSPWPAVKLFLLLAMAAGGILYWDLVWHRVGAIMEGIASLGCIALLTVVVFLAFDIKCILRSHFVIRREGV